MQEHVKKEKESMRKELITPGRIRHARLGQVLRGVLLLIVLCLSLVAMAPPRVHAASLVPRSPKVASTTSVNCDYNKQTCDGQDPYSTYGPDGNTLCSVGQYVVSEAEISNAYMNAYVKEMYSPNCGTNWAETDQINNSHYVIMNANITRASDGKHYGGTWYSWYKVWSPMVFAPNVAAHACGSIDNQPGGCAPWF